MQAPSWNILNLGTYDLQLTTYDKWRKESKLCKRRQIRQETGNYETEEGSSCLAIVPQRLVFFFGRW